jgi:hypothetical protein
MWSLRLVLETTTSSSRGTNQVATRITLRQQAYRSNRAISRKNAGESNRGTDEAQHSPRLLKICQQSFCFTCFALSRGGEKSNHTMSSCPKWKFRCFRCGATGCKRSDCSRHALVVQKLTDCNLCVSCALPPFVFDVTIHEGKFSMGKGCQLKDTILPTMLLMWHRQETKAAMIACAGRDFKELEDFLSWAFESRGGLGGFLHFLHDYCAK